MDNKAEFKNEVSLRKAADGIYAIQRNGYDCNCPFQPPMRVMKQQSVIAGGQPEAQILHPPCMSNCALFQMRQNEDGTIDVALGCGHHDIYENIKLNQ